MEIDHQLDDEGVVFYLRLEELLQLNEKNIEDMKSIAVARLDKAQRMQEFAPSKAALTLHGCELLSGISMHLDECGSSAMQGTSVSGGTDVQGTVYYVSDVEEQSQDELLGFMLGDILVCKMINPMWLPHVLQSKAVLCEVGGWLSHMAIVARENNIPMLVGCHNLSHLYGGAQIKVTKNGFIEILGNSSSNVTMRSEFG